MNTRFNLLLAGLLCSSSLLAANGISTRVVGGDDASEDDWPWMVTVYSGQYLCGGSLIDKNIVLTAAHCLYDENGTEITADNITVIVGGYDRSSVSRSSVFNISNTAIHSDYDSEDITKGNDLSLLTLESTITDITPLEIASTDTTVQAIDSEGDVTVLGWGSTVGYEYDETVAGSYPAILQEAVLPLKTDQQCADIYDSYYDSSSMLCAGTEGIDSCQGDSGGPLVINNNGTWQQIGIVSWGAGCASAAYPGVNTRVSEFEDWIASYISTNEDLNTLTVDSELTFTGVEVDSSETQALLISNNSDTQILLTFTLSDTSDFTFDASSCDLIEANTACSLDITYSPTSTYATETRLTITSDLPGGNTVSTILSGTPQLTTNSPQIIIEESGGGSIFFILTLPLLLIRRLFN